MFVYLYRASGTITQAILQHVVQSSPIYGERQCWVAPDGARGAVWSAGCLATAEGQTAPRGEEPFALAVGRLDRTVGLRGHVPSRATDSARVAAHAACTGRIGVPDLYGDFALASVNGKQLLIATDHLGIRRLYYTRTEEGYAVSTDLVALLALPDAPKVLNEEGLALLAVAYVGNGTGATSFREIRLLPGGHTLLLEPDRHAPMVAVRWWQPSGRPTRIYRDPRDYGAELSALFDKAVRSRLPAKGPVGATLSGGLDSTLVAAFAAQALGEQGRVLHCWTSVPHPGLVPDIRPGWDSDDWPYATQLARRYPNIRHEPVSPEGVCLLDVFEAINRSSATAVRNPANAFWMVEIARRAYARGCQTVLTGEHGNATISYAGDGGLPQLIRRGRWLRSARHILQLPERRGRQLMSSVLSAAIGERRAFRLQSVLGRSGQPGVHSLLLLMRPFVRDLHASRGPHARAIFDAEDRFKFVTRTRPSFAPDMAAHAGVTWVDPTADRKVIEYVLDCPPEAFLNDGIDRWQARQMGAGRVPDPIRWRRTRGEQVPEEAGMFRLYPDRYRAAWAEVRRFSWFSEYVDVDAVDGVFESLLAGRATPRLTASTMFRLLNIGMFINYAEKRWHPHPGRVRAPEDDETAESPGDTADVGTMESLRAHS